MTFQLYEPVRGTFNTQHSTDECREIAQDGLILLTEVGSTLHGVSGATTDDDMDEMGICIEPPDYVVGLRKFEQYEYRTQPVGQRSHAGDIDRVIYSLRKWTRLAAAGNPTVIMPLFAKLDQQIRYSNTMGDHLRTNANMFLSRQCGRKFLGYLDGQMKRYINPDVTDSKHASRPELVEAYGWDTKTGYHALRLAIQGTQLMYTGKITLPMAVTDREFLLRVRGGEYAKDEVTTLLEQDYIPELKIATEDTQLPDEPDYAEINSMLIGFHTGWWS